MATASPPFVECEQIHAGLAVTDIDAALEFYTKKLGFTKAFTWGDPPTFAGVNLGKVQMFLQKGTPDYLYELIEIPKTLLAKAATGRLEMKSTSTQSPKPGYCYVEENGKPLFSLYFDGSGERKLQIKGLQKSRCQVHASWKFNLLTDLL